MHATWPHPAHGGRLPEASWRWSRVRRPRTGFAHLDSEAFGAPLGRHYECPARSWLTSGRDQKWSDEKRGPRTEIAAVERREARRSAWTGISGEPEIGPTARRATRCGDPHQRRLGAPPPSPLEGESTASLGRNRRRENAVGCLKSESDNS